MKEIVKEKRINGDDVASTVALVNPQQIALVWGQVTPFLDKGEEYTRGYYKNEHFYNAIKSGQMQLWVAYKRSKVRTIMLTQLDFYPECIQFRYVFISGERGSFKEIVSNFKMVELWAIQNGATKGCVIGRDAWIKKLASFGYHKKSVLLVKDLVMTNGHDNIWRQ